MRSLGKGCPSSRYAVSPGASLVLETVGLGTVGIGAVHTLPRLILIKIFSRATQKGFGVDLSSGQLVTANSCFSALSFICKMPRKKGATLLPLHDSPPFRCIDFLLVKDSNGEQTRHCGEDSKMGTSRNHGTRMMLLLRTKQGAGGPGLRCRVSCCPTQELSSTQVPLFHPPPSLLSGEFRQGSASPRMPGH